MSISIRIIIVSQVKSSHKRSENFMIKEYFGKIKQDLRQILVEIQNKLENAAVHLKILSSYL